MKKLLLAIVLATSLTAIAQHHHKPHIHGIEPYYLTEQLENYLKPGNI